jgi:steroid delta-isomerase-like uncharacterized protein
MATASREANRRLARRVPEEMATEKNIDALADIFAPDAVERTPTGEYRGHEGIRESMEMIMTAFPDITATVEDIVAEGDTVAMRVTLRGTHEGPFAGIDPTGRSFEVDNMVFTRVEDGKITERWVLPDTLGMLRQLGVVDVSMK